MDGKDHGTHQGDRNRVMKKLPKYIVRKIEQANEYAIKAEQLNLEVEEWLENNGVEYAFDALLDVSEDHGQVRDVEGVQRVYDMAQ